MNFLITNKNKKILDKALYEKKMSTVRTAGKAELIVETGGDDGMNVIRNDWCLGTWKSGHAPWIRNG